MGLDWMLNNKPRPGSADEFYSLREMETLTPAEEERLKAASITPMETIEAPRVGIDDEATTYLLQQAEKCRQEIREAEEAGKPIANEGYVKHWSQTGVELVA